MTTLYNPNAGRSFWVRGEQATFTDAPAELIHGGIFYEYRIDTGYQAGMTGHTQYSDPVSMIPIGATP